MNSIRFDEALLALQFALAVAMTSCAVSADTRTQKDPGGTIRDSAGIEIVEHEHVRNAPTLVLDSSFLELGGLKQNEDEEFDSRNPFLSATLLSNGNIVVNDFNRLKWFTAEGEFIRSVGRTGSGPGEFSQIREVCRLVSDTLLTIDYSTGRLSLLDAGGKHITTHARPGFIPLGACSSDGTVVVQERPADASMINPTSYYSLRKLDGTVVRQLGVLPSPTTVSPFWLEPSIVISSDLFIVGPASSFAIEIRNLTGQVFRIVRVNSPLRPITEAELRKSFDFMYPGSAFDEQRSKKIARFMAMPRAATYPAYGHVRVDRARRIWINDYEDRQHWTIFSETGDLLGRLSLQGKGAELAGLEREWVAVRHRNADGALRLTFHRFTLEGR